MATKTPFEIRLDLLNLAQNICNERASTERMRRENDWYIQRELWTIAMDRGEKMDAPAYPASPVVSTEDVIAEAEKLNAFVSGK